MKKRLQTLSLHRLLKLRKAADACDTKLASMLASKQCASCLIVLVLCLHFMLRQTTITAVEVSVTVEDFTAGDASINNGLCLHVFTTTIQPRIKKYPVCVSSLLLEGDKDPVGVETGNSDKSKCAEQPAVVTPYE